MAFVEGRRLKVTWILDAHPHADYRSAARVRQERTGAPIGAEGGEGAGARTGVYDIRPRRADTLWDRLFNDGDGFRIGGL